MKRLLSLLIVCIMTLSLITFVSAEENINIILYSQFDKERQGAVTTLDGWNTIHPDGNRIEIVENPIGDGNCLKMIPIYGTPGGPFMEKANESGTSDCLMVEGKFRLDNHSACKVSLHATVSGTKMPLFIIDESRQMVDVDGNNILSPFPDGEFVKVALAIDKENLCYSVYINDRRLKANIPFTAIEGKTISAFRLSITNIKEGCHSELYVDDFAVYSSASNKPVRGCELSDVVSVHDTKHLNDGFLYVMNIPRMLRRGYAVSFETTQTLTPQIVRDKPYIPLRYSVEMLDGGGVGYSADSNTATIAYKGKSLTAIPGENAEMVNGHMLIDAAVYAEFIGKKMWYDEKSGVVFISDRVLQPNFHADLETLNDGIAQLVFDRPDAETVFNDIKSTTVDGTHPRLFINSAKIESLKELCKTDGFLINEKTALLKQADNFLNVGPTERTLSGTIYLPACQQVRVRIPTLALAYLLTGNTAYADRVWTEVNYVCNEWEDWNPLHFLDTAEMTFAVAIAYDWLYNYWNSGQKAVMEEALMNRGVREILKDYKDLPRQRRNDWMSFDNNWNVICYGGVAAAALALYDVSAQYEADCIDMLYLGLPNLENALMTYSPDGGYIEGPLYWDYCSMYLGFTVSMLQSVVGEDYGIIDVPGLKQTGYHNIDLYGPGGSFNFSDSEEGQTCTSATMWFVKAFQDAELMALYKDMKENVTFSTYYPYMDILYYDKDISTEADNVNRPLDSMYRRTEIVTMRNNWDLSSSNFIGFHAGKNNDPHGQLDAGTFVLDMNGKRFALDLGAGTYEETGGFFRYRYSAQGHNTYVVNPDNDYSQNPQAFTYITRFDSNEYEGYAIADITDAYVGKLTKFKRGLYATEGKSVFLVQDELSAAKAAEAYWQMHTEADIEIVDGGKAAVLTIDTDKVIVRLITDNDAVFEVRECMPYDGTPYYQVSDSDAFAKKLVIHLENVTEETVAVEFQHFLKGQDVPGQYFTEVTPMNAWKLGEIKEEWLAEKPVVNSISLNGEEVETFSAARRNYTISLDGSEVSTLNVTATADENTTVSVEYPEEYPGAVFVTADNGETTNTYSVYIKPIYDLEEVLGAEKLVITGVEASAEPELDNGKENAIDGNLETRWSAQGSGQYIQFKLSEEKEVSYVSLAFFKGDARISYFDVYTSVDGNNWKKVYSGESSGNTLDMETYKVETVSKANYVRIVGQGTSQSKEGWYSITEFSAYGN